MLGMRPAGGARDRTPRDDRGRVLACAANRQVGIRRKAILRRCLHVTTAKSPNFQGIAARKCVLDQPLVCDVGFGGDGDGTLGKAIGSCRIGTGEHVRQLQRGTDVPCLVFAAERLDPAPRDVAKEGMPICVHCAAKGLRQRIARSTARPRKRGIEGVDISDPRSMWIRQTEDEQRPRGRYSSQR